MNFKVCKLVRLYTKDESGEYQTPEQNDKAVIETVRETAIVSEATVKESEENCHATGLLYIVDEEATEAREAAIEAERSEKIEVIEKEFVDEGLDKKKSTKNLDDKL